MPRIALIAESFSLNATSEPFEIQEFNSPDIPRAEDLLVFDVTICVGTFPNHDRAAQIGGALRLASEGGATMAFAYNGRMGGSDPVVLSHVIPRLVFELVPESLAAVADRPAPNASFRRYLMEYGRGNGAFSNLPDDVEILAEKLATDSPRTTLPCAFAARAHQGVLYVVPYHLAGARLPFVESLVDSVLAHQQGSDDAPPSFFSELLLPGEAELATAIASLRTETAEKEVQVAALRRHKQLVGHLAGPALEALVIEELNVVLDGSGAEARDTEDIGEEDFEIVASGELIAVAESKAEAGGVSIGSINQLNNPRTAREKTTEELRGLLVVNQYRNDGDLARRRERLQDRLVAHARRQNVLVLRTWDLYQLVSRRLDGNNDSTVVRAAIEGGGGWLEATESEVTHHGAASGQ